MAGPTGDRKVLISGAGIAGLTLAILMKERGWQPVVVERERGLRTAGPMLDFFGTGWDVAERMGLTEELRAIRYPIKRMEFVDLRGRAIAKLSLSRLRKTLGGEYFYLRRSDLERILYARARATDVEIRFGTSVVSLLPDERDVEVKLNPGGTERFTLVFGADGVHSHVRALVFGVEDAFSFHLGGYVAAFHIERSRVKLRGALKLHEDTDTLSGFYPLGGSAVDATLVFRHPNVGTVPTEERLPLLQEKFSGSGSLTKSLLAEVPAAVPVHFDALTQIRMPSWHTGRVALLGDACGCLTLLAGQGAQMAMAGAYVLATELQRHANHSAAFQAYEDLMATAVMKRQIEAEKFAGLAIPSERSRFWLRRLAIRLIFSRLGLRFGIRFLGAKSVLADYR